MLVDRKRDHILANIQLINNCTTDVEGGGGVRDISPLVFWFVKVR